MSTTTNATEAGRTAAASIVRTYRHEASTPAVVAQMMTDVFMARSAGVVASKIGTDALAKAKADGIEVDSSWKYLPSYGPDNVAILNIGGAVLSLPGGSAFSGTEVRTAVNAAIRNGWGKADLLADVCKAETAELALATVGSPSAAEKRAALEAQAEAEADKAAKAAKSKAAKAERQQKATEADILKTILPYIELASKKGRTADGRAIWQQVLGFATLCLSEPVPETTNVSEEKAA